MMSQTNPTSGPDRSPIAPVTTREELISLLSSAAELEHGLACVCLFAAYSLKHDVSEGGLTDIQAEMVRGWRRSLASAAIDRMRHLAQLANLLTAIGAMPVIARPALLRSTSPSTLENKLTLEPFSQQLLDRLVTYEHLSDPLVDPGLAAHNGSESQNLAVASLTISDLYDKITRGFGSLPAEELFIGPKEAQANPQMLNLGKQLVSVVDLESAHAALATIIGSGEEGANGSAAGVFSTIRMEYLSALEEARQMKQSFEPVRPVVVNPGTQLPGETAIGTCIVDPLTAGVADLFNGAYDTMLLMLRSFFTHMEDTDADLERLASASLRLMTTVIRPLGEALAQMPVDSSSLPGRCAGPLFGDDGHIPELVHQTEVWAWLDERLWQLALAATTLRVTPGLPTEIQEATAALQDLTCQFAASEGPRSSQNR